MFGTQGVNPAKVKGKGVKAGGGKNAITQKLALLMQARQAMAGSQPPVQQPPNPAAPQMGSAPPFPNAKL